MPGPPHLQFWQAVDVKCGLQVALTLVDPDGELPAKALGQILGHTARLKNIDTRGIARVMGVTRLDRGGVVISEWVHGSSLKEVAGTNPWPIGVAHAMSSLIEAADAAHRSGLALSIDHPDRLRVSTKGDVTLAFPATLASALPDDDLYGIGSAMYALLLNRWPTPDAPPTGWSCADLDSGGKPLPPSDVDPHIPFLISAATGGLLHSGSGIRSATTALSLLEQAADEFEVATTARESPELPPPGGYAGFRNFGPRERDEAGHRQVMTVFLGAAAVVVFVLLVIFASVVNRLVADPKMAIDTHNIGLQELSPVEEPQPTAGVNDGRPVMQATIKPVRAEVFSPDGVPDNPQSARLAIDGDPTTAWSTDTYKDAVPFPTFKDGVGLLLQLPQPTALSAVTVDLDSTGTVVQIRSAQSTSPVTLADTAELTPPTPMQPGDNTIPVRNQTPVSTVLLWISTLGSTDGESRSAVSETTLQAAVPPA